MRRAASSERKRKVRAPRRPILRIQHTLRDAGPVVGSGNSAARTAFPFLTDPWAVPFPYGQELRGRVKTFLRSPPLYFADPPGGFSTDSFWVGVLWVLQNPDHLSPTRRSGELFLSFVSSSRHSYYLYGERSGGIRRRNSASSLTPWHDLLYSFTGNLFKIARMAGQFAAMTVGRATHLDRPILALLSPYPVNTAGDAVRYTE